MKTVIVILTTLLCACDSKPDPEVAQAKQELVELFAEKVGIETSLKFMLEQLRIDQRSAKPGDVVDELRLQRLEDKIERAEERIATINKRVMVLNRIAGK